MVQHEEVAAILAAVDEIDRIGDEEWRSSLSARKMAELEFHDRDRDPTAQIEASLEGDTFEKFYGNRKYYSVTERSNGFVQSWIAREAKGRVFLDYACGNGDQALFAAQEGAALSLGRSYSPSSWLRAVRSALAA